MREGNFIKRVSMRGAWLVSGVPTSAPGQWWFKGALKNADGTNVDLSHYRGRLVVAWPRVNGKIVTSAPPDGAACAILDFGSYLFQTWDANILTKPLTIVGNTFEVIVRKADIPYAAGVSTMLSLDFGQRVFTSFDRVYSIPYPDADGTNKRLPFSIQLWNYYGWHSNFLIPLYGVLEADPSITVPADT